MTDANNDPKAFFAGVFDRASDTYDQIGQGFFAHFGRGLVEFAPPAPGSRVLDVAAGRGAITFAAAERLGGSGSVLAVDIAAGMVAQIEKTAAGRGLVNVSARVMDAEALDLPDASIDAAYCGQALFFFPNYRKALAGLRRVIKPGGMFAASIWSDHDPRWSWLGDLYQRYQKDLKPVPDIADEFPEGEQKISAAIQAAGFEGIRWGSDQMEVVYRDFDQFWQAQWSHGTRGMLERFPEDRLADYRDGLLEAIRQNNLDKGGIPLLYRSHYFACLRP